MARSKFSNGFQFSNGKSLNEQVAGVLNSRKSRDEKYTDLLMLGLRDKEVQAFLNTSVKVRQPRLFSRYTFGVEIECYNADRRALVECIRGKGVNIQAECYNHTDNRNHFKVVDDGSLSGNNSNEVVSPVLSSSDGMGRLKKVCEGLNEVGAKVNRSCGLHVHIGAADLTEEQYCNVFKNYYRLQGVIDSFLAPSRRDAFYAQHLDGRIMGCTTRLHVRMTFRNRYWVVNPCAYDRHKTIEFRQHQGSTDFKKIQNWVHFCAKLVEWSKTNVLTNAVTSVDEIPFLTASEKAFFKARQTHFVAQAA